MMATRFCQYVLRTTDVTSAEAFYTDIFGGTFLSQEISITELPVQARAKGARPHWLGQLGVDNVNEATNFFVAKGGQLLGPQRDGAPEIVLRDPFGATLALRSKRAYPAESRVAMHLLHCSDHDAAFAVYASICNWDARGTLNLGEHGIHQRFAWDEAGPSVGSIANTALSPHVHAHWLYFFRVDDLESSLARARALGGVALPIATTEAGDLVAACDDPEGAAFGLYQHAR